MKINSIVAMLLLADSTLALGDWWSTKCEALKTVPDKKASIDCHPFTTAECDADQWKCTLWNCQDKPESKYCKSSKGGFCDKNTKSIQCLDTTQVKGKYTNDALQKCAVDGT